MTLGRPCKMGNILQQECWSKRPCHIERLRRATIKQRGDIYGILKVYAIKVIYKWIKRMEVLFTQTSTPERQRPRMQISSLKIMGDVVKAQHFLAQKLQQRGLNAQTATQHHLYILGKGFSTLLNTESKMLHFFCYL